MSVTVIKEGSVLRLIEASGPIPEGSTLVLYTEEELRAAALVPTAWEAAQLDSVFRESDEDWGTSLDSLVKK